MSVKPENIKLLREKTGAGMMDCKKALSATNGDMDSAVDWLRKKGLSAAEKKSGRVAAEGLIGLKSEGLEAALVEINTETDFVARNTEFQETVANVASISLSLDGDINKVAKTNYPDSDRNINEQITHLIATIGENITLRRCSTIKVNEGVIGEYIHSAIAPGLGRIGVLVGLESSGNKDQLVEFGRQLAMHIAASNPLAVSIDNLSQEKIQRERQILMDQAEQSGKPRDIIEKMVEGRLRKYYEEVVLLDQTWVIDGETKVSKVLDNLSTDIGSNVIITKFVRFALGEGIEKETTDFASEVAQTLNS